MYMEIDNELINLNQITKIKKAKTGLDAYSVVLEEQGKPIKTIKYDNEADMLLFYQSLKDKVLGSNTILEYNAVETTLSSTITRLFGW